MSDRICPCGKVFGKPSLLKRHQNGKLGCIPYMRTLVSQDSPTAHGFTHDIERERENTKVGREFFCKFCNKKLASKYSLERHCNTCDKNDNRNDIDTIKNKVNNNLSDFIINVANILNMNNLEKIDIDVKNGNISYKYLPIIQNDTINNQGVSNSQLISTNKDINNDSNNDSSRSIIRHKINVPDLEYNELNDEITFPTVINKSENNNNTSNSNVNIGNTFSAIMNRSLVNTSNSSLTNNTNNTNTNINITNNIGDGVPYVYPFGYENINFLTENEVLEILKSTDGANLVLEKIYSQIENNNFMKFNKKDKHMVYINKPNNVAYCNDREFTDKLYEQSKILLQRVFFLYFKRLSTAHQNIVWKNIRIINDILDKKPASLEDKYNNLINKNINNGENRKVFQTIKKAIESNDNKIINKTNDVYDKTSKELGELQDEINRKTLNMDDIKNLWNQLQTDESVSYSNFKNDLMYNRFEDTPRFKVIQKIIEKELEYVNRQTLSIGDLNDFYTHIESRINTELKNIRESFNDISDNYIDEIKEFLINKPLEEHKKQLDLIKFKNNSKTITQ